MANSLQKERLGRGRVVGLWTFGRLYVNKKHFFLNERLLEETEKPNQGGQWGEGRTTRFN